MLAYQSLRLDLAGGARLPGDQIVVSDIANRLRISPTPVREALARLSGERLVDDRRNYGYFVPLPSWFDLVELYDLCELHLDAALREAEQPQRERTTLPAAASGPGSPSVGDAGGVLHHAVLALSSNARLAEAGRTYVDGLAAARRIEAELYGADLDCEARLARLLGGKAWAQARSLLRDAFQLRRARAEPVAFALAAASRTRNRRHIV